VATEPDEGRRGARAGVHAARLAHPHAPLVAAEQRDAGLEIGQRLDRTALRQPQPPASSGDRHGRNPRRPARLGEQLQQRVSPVQLTGFDGHIR
jgi:hypothetical protein